MKLTAEERDGLRQRFLNDVEVNLDELIVLTQKALAKKYDDEIKKVKDDILNLIKDDSTNKEIENLFSKNLMQE